MDENYLELYNHLKAEGLTDLNPEDFFEKYKEGDANKEFFNYLKSEELTDLDNTAFNQKYFSSKKKRRFRSYYRRCINWGRNCFRYIRSIRCRSPLYYSRD